jgi:hypothetical protein
MQNIDTLHQLQKCGRSILPEALPEYARHHTISPPVLSVWGFIESRNEQL